MGYSLSDEEIRAIYRRIDPTEENSENREEDKEDNKAPFLSLAVQKALGIIGY